MQWHNGFTWRGSPTGGPLYGPPATWSPMARQHPPEGWARRQPRGRLWRRVGCGWLGWHSPTEWARTDGPLTFGRCLTCGFTGQFDSQGNLF